MVKLQIKYQTEEEKQRMVNIISTGAIIKKISDPYKSGKYYRICLDVE
jgi:hypothetical protein